MDKYVELKGGMDVQTPPIAVEAGKCRSAVNVYESVNGGYTTVKGYEGLDGGTLPSESVYYVCRCTRMQGSDAHSLYFPLYVPLDDSTSFQGDATTFDMDGDVLHMDSSVDEVTFILMNPSLIPTTFPFLFQNTNVAPWANTYRMDSMTLSGGATESWETFDAAEMPAEVKAARMADVRLPIGTGDIVGIHQIDDITIAWRENGANNILSVIDDTTPEQKNWIPAKQAQVYLIDKSGAAVTKDARDVLGKGAEAYLTNGFTIQDVRTPSLNPLTLDYVLLIQGGYVPVADLSDGDILTSVTGEVFGTVIGAGLTDWEPLAGGKMTAFTHNFYAGVDTKRAYFADGVNPAMYYDPISSALVPIATTYFPSLGDGYDIAVHVAAFQSRLIGSTVGGGFFTSVGGDPMTVDGTLGSVEIGVGEFVTGFQNASADELLVFTTGSTWSMSGSGPTDWRLRRVTGDSGAKPFCTVNMGEILAADDVGIVNVKRSDVLGGFTSSTITNDIQGLYKSYDKTNSCSTVIKGLEQMRFYFGTEGLIGTRVAYQSKNGNDSIRYGFTRTTYADPVYTINTERRLDGIERTVFGSDAGRVFVMESGTCFDGNPIASEIVLAYNHVSAPWERKRWEAIALETSSKASTVALTLDQTVNDGDKKYNAKAFTVSSSDFGPNEYNVTSTKLRLKGSGYNVQFSISRSSSTEDPISMTGYTLRYTPRGLVTI
jgi:hypothetical protein